MTRTITNVEFRRSFGEILDYVKGTKREVLVNKHGVPWVVLVHPSKAGTSGVGKESALNLRLNLANYLDSVHYKEKPLVITRRGESIVCIRPPEAK